MIFHSELLIYFNKNIQHKMTSRSGVIQLNKRYYNNDKSINVKFCYKNKQNKLL